MTNVPEISSKLAKQIAASIACCSKKSGEESTIKIWARPFQWTFRRVYVLQLLHCTFTTVWQVRTRKYSNKAMQCEQAICTQWYVH